MISSAESNDECLELYLAYSRSRKVSVHNIDREKKCVSAVKKLQL